MVEPQELHQELVDWGVIEPDAPMRFTRRFQAALARAAARLQTSEQAGEGTGGDAVRNQVETALGEYLHTKGMKAAPGHVAFVRAVHVSTLPEGVRAALGL